MSMSELPEGCVANVLSLTDPQEACRLSLVSTNFRDAARSDTVWERFLPPDYQSLISRSTAPFLLRDFPSKKQLYLSLCDNPILIDDGKTSFWVDKLSGKKSFMISARGLTIIWGDTPNYWRWNSDTNSRFGEFAELLGVCWLEIRGKIKIQELSTGTNYGIYLVYKLLNRESYGFDRQCPPLEVEVGLVNSSETFNYKANVRLEYADMERRVATQRKVERKDGWLEMKLGLFFNAGYDKDGELEAIIMEIKGGHWKRGLLVQGIEFRPRKSIGYQFSSPVMSLTDL